MIPFFSKAKMYNMHKTCKLTSIHTMVIHEDWGKPMQDIKTQLIWVVVWLIDELYNKFHAQELLNVIGIIYPHYWL